MATVARYQYEEVTKFILFPSLIHSIKQRNGFLWPISYFNYFQDTILTQLGSVVMIVLMMTTGVMKDRIFQYLAPHVWKVEWIWSKPSWNAGMRPNRADISSKRHWCQQSQAFKHFLLVAGIKIIAVDDMFVDHVPDSSSLSPVTSLQRIPNFPPPPPS